MERIQKDDLDKRNGNMELHKEVLYTQGLWSQLKPL